LQALSKKATARAGARKPGARQQRPSPAKAASKKAARGKRVTRQPKSSQNVPQFAPNFTV
jgi:hypothetical protein